MESLRLLQQHILGRALQFPRSSVLQQSLRQSSRALRHQAFRSQPTNPLHAARVQPTRSLFTCSIRSRTAPKHNPFARTRIRGRGGRRFQSTTSSAPNEANLSLSQRMRKLSREYGWSAVGVYFLLSALDFPFCFVAVRTLGTDRIGHWEHVVLSR